MTSIEMLQQAHEMAANIPGFIETNEATKPYMKAINEVNDYNRMVEYARCRIWTTAEVSNT